MPLTFHDPVQADAWLRARVAAPAGTLRTDSRRVGRGDAFLAWPGAATDARAHVPQALAQGAAACLVEAEGVERFGFDAGDERVAAYAGLKAASGPIASHFFDHPSTAIDLLAVTGTNGKTSTVWWLAQALSALQPPIPCAMVGTLGVGRPPQLDPATPADAIVPTGLTTPDPVLLQRSLRAFADAGLRACAIEASSIGIVEHRLDGARIRTALFTNFTQDHLDYHGDMQAYWQAKLRLFDWPGLRAAVVNLDDAKAGDLLQALDGRALDVWTVSLTAPEARLRARDITHVGGGLAFSVAEGVHTAPLATRLIGQYNVSNLLGVIAAMRAQGVPLEAAVEVCARLQPVPGRMECQGGAGQPLVAVDYAHTPDALDKALAALRPVAAERGGALWCVFGCGGDRDPAKRPLMGRAAAQGADHVLVTSDNPRGEAPESIIDAIVPGLAGHVSVRREADRASAIAQALAGAGAQDVVLVAGKGHEPYQEVRGERRPFSDMEQVRLALAARGSATA